MLWLLRFLWSSPSQCVLLLGKNAWDMLREIARSIGAYKIRELKKYIWDFFKRKAFWCSSKHNKDRDNIPRHHKFAVKQVIVVLIRFWLSVLFYNYVYIIQVASIWNNLKVSKYLYMVFTTLLIFQICVFGIKMYVWYPNLISIIANYL